MKRLFFLLAVVLFGVASSPLVVPSAFAADAGSSAEKKTAKPRARPVTGKVEVIDSAMKTITLSGEKKQVLYVTSETVLNKMGKPALFSDIVVGETIGGSVVDEGGKLMLKSLRIGPKPEAEKPAKKPKKGTE
jgi:Cu/Ag efflux protein CusF